MEVVPQTPDLLDIVDVELREWRRSEKDGVPDAERQRVIEVLEKMQRRQEAWRERVRLVRFPDEGQPFDEYKHRLVDTKETANLDQVNTVCEVVRSGYEFRDAKTALREARVVMFVPQQEGKDETVR
jgi:molecular chaperone GrpE (heat shock protein)